VVIWWVSMHLHHLQAGADFLDRQELAETPLVAQSSAKMAQSQLWS
jgi:hypothetical protein